MLLPAIVKALVLPPGGILVLAALGLALRRARPRLGTGLLVSAWVLLALLSMPGFSGWLASTLDRARAIDVAGPAPKADAIVILSGDVYFSAPEYGGQDTIGLLTLMRLRYGAWLHRKTGLPMLVTGGPLQEGLRPLGEMMAETLEQEFALKARWVETEARTTMGNAKGSARLLRESGVSRILLVTSAMHMPRARAAFEAQGLEVVPAPTGIAKDDHLIPGDFVPRSSALQESTYALHEWLGRAWYRVAG